MLAVGLNKMGVTSFASSGPKSPVMTMVEALTGSAWPGVIVTFAIASAVWM
jgi:hypothetical protein